MTEILIGQILDIKHRVKKKFLKSKIYPSYIGTKQITISNKADQKVKYVFEYT